MRILRTDSPQPEYWDVEEVMAHLSCDRQKAKEIMEDCRKQKGIKGYGAIEKHILLDFINEKQLEQRAREARHAADIATAESLAVLKEQVKVLHLICDSSSEDARKARTHSLIDNFISGISIVIAILALILK